MEVAAELHVACMPFPARRGTQAAVASMVRARATERHTALLVHDGYQAAADASGIELIRCGRASSMNRVASEVSFSRVWQDLRLLRWLRKHAGRYERIVAHNIEAALVCVAAQVRTWTYVAHTLFEAELPKLVGLPTSIGRQIDAIATSASCVVAVSPWLASRLGAAYVPIPWQLGERSESTGGKRYLISGNLDAYQGIALLADVVRATSELGYTIATDDPLPLSLNHARVSAVDLPNDVIGRARLHASHRALVVLRNMWGGVSVKVLDALAHDLPVITTPAALGGIAADVRLVQPNLGSITSALRSAKLEGLAGKGRRYIATEHSAVRFNRAFDDAHKKGPSQCPSLSVDSIAPVSATT